MQQVVATDHIRSRVGKKGVSESHFPAMRFIDLYGVHADCGYVHSTLGEIRKTTLETPQLGVTKRSPMAAIKNQDNAIRGKQIG